MALTTTVRSEQAERDAQSDQRTADRFTILRLAISVALGVLAVGMVVYKVNVYPQIGSDEWWLLGRLQLILDDFNLDDRVAMDSEWRQMLRSSAPPMNIPLRYAIHTVLGADVGIGRFISAAQFVTLGLLASTAAWRLGAPREVAALGLPIFLLTPAVFFTARTYRYEQDLFFLGTLAILLVAMMRRPGPLGLLMASISGIATGMTSVMHLFGIGFGASIVGAHALRWLRGERHNLSWRTILAWVIGAAVPVFLTLAYFFTDPSENRAVENFLRSREALQLDGRRVFLRGLFPAPIPGLPDRVVEIFNAIRWGLMPQPPAAAPLLTNTVLNVLGLVVAVFVVGGLTVAVLRRPQATGPARPGDTRMLLVMMAWLLVVGQVVLFITRPHTDYTVYVSGTMVLAAFFGVALLGSGARRATLRWLALLVVVVVEIGYLGPLLASSREPVGVALNVQTRSMRLVSQALGIDLDRVDGPPLYADLTSWAAGGGSRRALFDVLILERVGIRSEAQGTIFSVEWLNGMATTIAPSTGQPLDPERRRGILANLLDGKQLAAVMRVDPNSPRNPNVRMWYLRDAPPSPLFAIVAADGSLSMRYGVPVIDTARDLQSGQHRSSQRERLGEGDYFALVSGTGLTSSHVQAEYNRQDVNGSRLDIFPQEYGGGRLWLTLTRPTAVVFNIDTVSTTAGAVRLQVWRLGDATAAP